jgi:hypothetical protein
MWRRLCCAFFECASQCGRQLVQLDFVGVELGGVDLGVAQQRTKRRNVSAAFLEEAVRVSMP